MRLEQRANMGAMKELRNTLNRRSSASSGLHLSRICAWKQQCSGVTSLLAIALLIFPLNTSGESGQSPA